MHPKTVLLDRVWEMQSGSTFWNSITSTIVISWLIWSRIIYQKNESLADTIIWLQEKLIFLQTVFGMWTLFTHLVEEGSFFLLISYIPKKIGVYFWKYTPIFFQKSEFKKLTPLVQILSRLLFFYSHHKPLLQYKTYLQLLLSLWSSFAFYSKHHYS